MRPNKLSSPLGKSVSDSRIQYIVAFGLLAATLFAYWPVFHSQFVNYDDPVYVTDNPVVRNGLSAQGFAWAFRNVEAEFWQPVVWLSHMFDWQIYGPRAGGHHFTSLLIHIANTLLLFLLFKRMTGAVWRSGILAGLFALHPLHVESVAWIAERKDVLSTFFGLLSLLAYIQYARSKKTSPTPKAARDTGKQRHETAANAPLAETPGSPGSYALSLFCFALSLMSKSTLVTLPFLLWLLDYWPLARIDLKQRKSFASAFDEKIPFFILSLASCLATFAIQKSRHNVGGMEQYPVPLRLTNAAMSYVIYLRKTIWPSDLAMFYPYPDSWPIAQVIVAGSLLLAISAGAVFLLRQRPYVAVGWFWFLGTLVPMIGLVQVSHHAMADRYTYFPLIGFFLLLVWGAADILRTLPAQRFVAPVTATVGLAACALACHRQVSVWKDSITLNEHALRVTSNNYIAHANLGAVYADEQKLDEALAEFQTAFKIESSLRTHPDQPSIRFGLGTILAMKGQLDAAKVHFVRLLEIQPEVPKLQHNFATLLMLQGNVEEAIEHYQAALQLNPHYDEARANLSRAMYQRQQWTQASEHVTSANQLVKQDKPREAAEEYRQALKLRPDWPEVLNNFAWLLATEPSDNARNGAEAVALAERACQLTGRTNFWMLSTLAAAYAEAGNFQAAVATQQNVCDLAAAQGQADKKESFSQRLESYRSGHAYRRPRS